MPQARSLRPATASCFTCNRRDRGCLSTGNTVLWISTMSTAPFGVGGRPRRKTRPFVEDVPRIGIGDLARSLFTRLAREGVRIVINGAEMVLDVVCEPRHFGGDGRWFFLCTCGRRVCHLYYVRADERAAQRLACRRCAGPLTYASQHTRRRGLNRVRRLREKIGALPSPLVPLPPRPRHWRRDYWVRTIARLAVAEATIAAELHAMIPRVRRRLRHGHSNRDARRT